jgi:hypothetical protein
MAAVLPEAFRQAAKLNLENARKSFDMLMAASENAWSIEAKLLLPQSGVATLVQEMSRLARSNVDANFDAAQKLIDADNFGQAFRLCVEHMQNRHAAFTRQLQEVQSLAADKKAPATETTDHQRQTSAQTPASPNHYRGVAPAPKGKGRKVSRSRQTTAPTLAAGAKQASGQTKSRTAAAQATAPRVSETKESSRKVSPKGSKRKSPPKQQG